jgi:hypothetical protein
VSIGIVGSVENESECFCKYNEKRKEKKRFLIKLFSTSPLIEQNVDNDIEKTEFFSLL